MIITRTTDEQQAWSAAARSEGRTIGFVPTMGFLHRGHATLIERVRPLVDELVVSIYVNPLQFGPTEDLDRYPRNPDGDAALCQSFGADCLFMPSTLYPPDFATTVAVAGLTTGLCGASRPGHFDGVATVVTRLFGLTQCQVAAFGEKDYQQLAVIRRAVRDLALPVTIVPVPLVRDVDGLALSSRNVYLSPVERARALSLSRALHWLAEHAPGQPAASVLAEARAMLDVDQLDYLSLVDADSLAPLDHVDRPARALVAAFVGKTRLIDNVAVG